jgi:hypothetical protein
MYYRNYEGYYTLDQVMEAFGYLKISDPTGSKYSHHQFYNHVKRILEMMKKYHMDIILAKEVIQYDSWFDVMVNTYRINPIPFKSMVKTYNEYKITAPNFKTAQFCGNCLYFDDLTEQDDMLSGCCDIHTELDEDYNPPLKRPMSLSCYGVCDDFRFKDEV